MESLIEKIKSNVVLFVIIYIIFMLPTYILPYYGSNAIGFNGLVDTLANPMFYFHILTYVILIFITRLRGIASLKKWIVIFPILAMVFDIVPILSNIPFIPTIMHIVAIVMGVYQTEKASE